MFLATARILPARDGRDSPLKYTGNKARHVRNWSYQTLEREVRANLVYRAFGRIGGEKVPDAKTMGRLGQVIGPEVVAGLHQRMVELAVENKVVRGRKMRVDTRVVETNIHYPTDSSLLGDGARVLTRLMKKVAATVGGLKERVRNRMRSVRKKVIGVAIAARRKSCVKGACPTNFDRLRNPVGAVGRGFLGQCYKRGHRDPYESKTKSSHEISPLRRLTRSCYILLPRPERRSIIRVAEGLACAIRKASQSG